LARVFLGNILVLHASPLCSWGIGTEGRQLVSTHTRKIHKDNWRMSQKQTNKELYDEYNQEFNGT
jgi:hypothetical protein